MQEESKSAPNLLYILGTGRSGSTLLEIILSKGEGVVACGELTSLVKDGFIANKDCSCSEPCHSCEFWKKVIFALNLSDDSIKVWSELQKQIDWHDGFIKQLFGQVDSTQVQEYRRYNKQLIEAIFKVSESQTIIDSSKYVGRCFALSRLLGSEFKTICLTRSPSGLMRSFQKPNKGEQPPKGSLSVLLYYCSVTLLIRLMALFLKGKVLFVTFEELLEKPIDVLFRIENWSHIDLSESRRLIESNSSFVIEHLVTGNRLRKEGCVRLEPTVLKGEPRGLGAQITVKALNVWKWVLRL